MDQFSSKYDNLVFLGDFNPSLKDNPMALSTDMHWSNT